MGVDYVIVLPNSFERYLSALRISVSVSILKRGLQIKHLKSLEKIYIAEALMLKNTRQSVSVNTLCANLLGAVSIIKDNFSFKCDIINNLYLNKNLFTILLLYLAKEKTFLKITEINDFLLITLNGKTCNLSPFIRALNGLSLFEIKTNKSVIIIPADESGEKSVEIETEWEYLFNKFSVVNMVFDIL